MKKRMWTIVGSLAAICMLTLSGCGCEHEWVEATCVTPKTCALCDETEGEALGHSWVDATCLRPQYCELCDQEEGVALEHTPDEWTVVETDVVNATEVLKKYCKVCNEQLDKKKRDMESLHNTYHFLMTPKQFSERLSDMLESIDGCELVTVTGETEDYFACGVMDADTGEKVCVFLFVGDGDPIGKKQKNEICFDGALGTIKGSNNIAFILHALVRACDPDIDFSEAKTVAKSIVSGEVTKNGITYSFVESSGNEAVLVFALESE